MHIISAQFVKGVVGPDPILENGLPQVACIGRSNVGKSSVINALVNQKNLARTSSFPGRTQEINVFLINKSFYLVDLPGYGFAKVSKERRAEIEGLINWYFFDSTIEQKRVLLLIDAEIGLTGSDKEMLAGLEINNKKIVIVANKIDKIAVSKRKAQLEKIQAAVGEHKVVPFSAEKRIGINELMAAIKW